MRNKRLATLLPTLIMGLLTVMAQQLSDANITGHVVETGTGEHLPGITIHISGTSLGATTDASGHYAIRDIAPGTYSVEARCIGYISSTKKLTVKANQTIELNFEITPDALQLDQVVVTGNRSEVFPLRL